MLPGIQVIDRTGRVDYLYADTPDFPLLAPNDLCLDGAGRLYFTDPSEPYNAQSPQARGKIVSVGPDGTMTGIDVGPTFPNGIVYDGSAIVFVESYTRKVMRLTPNGTEEIAQLPPGHVPDGLAVRDAALFITTTEGGTIDVITPDGRLVILDLDVDPPCFPTNCAFTREGDLYITDAADLSVDEPSGRLLRIDAAVLGDALSAAESFHAKAKEGGA